MAQTTFRLAPVAGGEPIEVRASQAALVAAYDYGDTVPRTRTARGLLVDACWAIHSARVACEQIPGVRALEPGADPAQTEAACLELLSAYRVDTVAPDDAGERDEGGEPRPTGQGPAR